jgi:hypothetical protein
MALVFCHQDNLLSNRNDAGPVVESQKCGALGSDFIKEVLQFFYDHDLFIQGNIRLKDEFK